MNKKCEETIDENKKEFFRTARRLAKLDYERRENHDSYREPLSIEVTDCIRVILCTGGPHEEFEVYFDIMHREFTRGVFVRMDWFDRAERRLTDDELETLVTLYDLELVAERYYPESEKRNNHY